MVEISEGLTPKLIKDLSEKELETENVIMQPHKRTYEINVSDLVAHQKKLREAFVEINGCDSLELYLHLNKMLELMGFKNRYTDSGERKPEYPLWSLKTWMSETLKKYQQIGDKALPQQRRIDPESKTLRQAMLPGGATEVTEKWCLKQSYSEDDHDTVNLMYGYGSGRTILPLELVAREGVKCNYIILEGFDHKSAETLRTLAATSELPIEELIEATRALEAE